jgi:hypothetical protein
MEFLLSARTPFPLPARSDDGQPSGEEKECTGISQHLLHWMKVAVSAASKMTRSVHIEFDRARSRRHTETSPLGLERGNSRRIRAGLAAKRGRLVAYVIRDDQVGDDGQPAGGRPRRRTRHLERRGRTVRFALTDQEYAEVSAAARHAGLARGAFAAEAALSVARGVAATPDAPLRDAFHALDRAALLVRRIGVNLNQAVAKLNATGQWSGDLVPYAEESARRAARLEAAGEDLRKRLLRTIRAPGSSGPRGRMRGPESRPGPAGPG